MIRHCVMFKWNDQADDARKAAFLDGLVGLLQTVETVRGYAYGSDAAFNEGNHDFCVTVDFDDEAGYVAYRDDADHQAFIASTVRPILETRAAVQFQY